MIIVTGQTATGKTRLALELAKKYNIGEELNLIPEIRDPKDLISLLYIIPGIIVLGFIVFGIILALLNPSAVDSLNDNSLGFNLIDRIVSLFLFAIYMGTIEAITKGRSIGKYITGTKAVNNDGSLISIST